MKAVYNLSVNYSPAAEISQDDTVVLIMNALKDFDPDGWVVISPESLPPSDTTKIEEEAEKKYPYQIPQREIVLSFAEVVDMKRAAHIAAVKMYAARIADLEQQSETWKKLSHAYVDRIKELEAEVGELNSKLKFWTSKV